MTDRLDGVLVLNKPQNWTSYDCVAVCRRALGIKKMGHGGTLDPMATGVLPVFVGKATRIMQYMDLDTKAYRCTARLGIDTDTMDIWGNTVSQRDTSNVTGDMIASALLSFRGEIQQVPPKYSALKVNGKKLYQYAREGVKVEIKPRSVHIKELDVVSINMDRLEVTFDVTCSKGTYIRSICHDLGEMLGCGAAMAALERTRSGAFCLDNSVNPEELKLMDEDGINEIKAGLLPIDFALTHFGRATMPLDRARYFVSGNSIWLNQVRFEEAGDGKNRANGRKLYKVYCKETGKFLGTGYKDCNEGVLKSDKIFVTRQEL